MGDQQNLSGSRLREQSFVCDQRVNVFDQTHHMFRGLRSKPIGYTEENVDHFLMNVSIGEGFTRGSLPVSYRREVVDPCIDPEFQLKKKLFELGLQHPLSIRRNKKD
jgi:hypothetical protein